jgi:acetyl coenzyme A synthetase (ADP forming)-like protein
MEDIERFFTPRSIAVIGASRNPIKLGYVLLDNLQRARYRGTLYAVNPHPGRILGLPTYPSVLDLPETPDLAILTVPAAAVREVLEQCCERGVRAVVIITAGFRETGPAGAQAERELVELARRYGVRLVGPNSVGVINTAIGMNATFAETAPFQYEVGMLSQSGAIATAILDWARSINMGFSKFVSLGNMADLNEVDFLEYLGRDAETKIIVGYLESVSEGRRFLDVARRISLEKPIILIKVGATAAGARAARSHTGALASAEAIVDAAFRQAGIVRATTLAEFFDYLLCFSYAPLPRGPRVAVVTNAGGPGVMAADAIERMGLALARFTPETAGALERALPEAAATANPVDVLGDAPADRYQTALELVASDPAVDGVLVLLTPQRVTEPERTARVISHLAREQTKPVTAVFMGGDAVSRGRDMLDEARVPVYAYPERAVRALAAMVRYSDFLREARSEAAAAGARAARG